MYDTEVLSAFERVEQAAGSLWTLIDDASTLFAEYENAHDNVASQLKAMRRSYAASVQFLRGLQEFQGTMHDRIEKFQRNVRGRIEQFAQKVGQFENHISRTALNYGLNLLPDDVLLEIFVLAGKTLHEKVVLSLVCKRFRRVMMSMRKMWDEYWIESSQTPEQIISIAEGNGFVSLKARIHSPTCTPSSVEDWVANRGLDLEEYWMRYFKFSVGLILPFGPEELDIRLLGERDWEAIDASLAVENMQNVCHLVMRDVSRTIGGRLLDRWHLPLLRNLEVGFVPGAALGTTVVQCTLGSDYRTIKEVEIDALREFLAAAKSLQDLRLIFNSTVRFYEVCDLPSLRSLEVNFEPHPSLASHLVRFRLFLPWHRAASVSRLLDFLSSSEALQELVVQGEIRKGFSEDPGTVDASPVVTMPSVVSCEFSGYMMGPILIANLRTPMLRTLKLGLGGLDTLSPIMRDKFRTSLQLMSSLEDVELKGDLFVKELDEIVRYAPPHLDSFSLKCCGFEVGAGWNTSPVPRRGLIRFIDCYLSFMVFMPAFVEYLKAVGLGRMELQFTNCAKCRDGTFGLDDVMSAWVDT